MSTPPLFLRDRFQGCLLGLALGDALGTSVEFMPRGSFEPLRGLRGGGPFALPIGAWTDDTSMALCLAHSLLERQGFHPVDQMNRYVNWWRHGYLSSTGECFDIGMTIARALARYEADGEPFAGSSNPSSAGNGCIMRLAPVPMYYFDRPAALMRYAVDSARTTHGAAEALDATGLLAAQLHLALAGADRHAVVRDHGYQAHTPAVAALARADWIELPYAALSGSGYVIDSLQAALWCFFHGEDFAAATLAAANLGDDADTTAAVCGQLAGAHHGRSGLPADWLAALVAREQIERLADRLYDERAQPEGAEEKQ
ncbi:ADP-ribosylglycohydrolase family protein [Chitinimonas lacunae]|uniref:ADP-ribosylglycohydrolase family protein n=1 Tax=Chitinimonas lacunae TaxID=1963018 RepID=A0ABV8MQX9_9NEIS